MAVEAPSPREPLSLPAPQLFDILPALHEILSRLDHAPTSLSALTTLESDNNEIDARYTDLQPLEPKDLPNEVLPLKARIRKAVKELEKLPDMDRTRDEQMEEIRLLEEMLREQEEFRKRMAKIAANMTDVDDAPPG